MHAVCGPALRSLRAGGVAGAPAPLPRSMSVWPHLLSEGAARLTHCSRASVAVRCSCCRATTVAQSASLQRGQPDLLAHPRVCQCRASLRQLQRQREGVACALTAGSWRGAGGQHAPERCGSLLHAWRCQGECSHTLATRGVVVGTDLQAGGVFSLLCTAITCVFLSSLLSLYAFYVRWLCLRALRARARAQRRRRRRSHLPSGLQHALQLGDRIIELGLLQAVVERV